MDLRKGRPYPTARTHMAMSQRLLYTYKYATAGHSNRASLRQQAHELRILPLGL